MGKIKDLNNIKQELKPACPVLITFTVGFCNNSAARGRDSQSNPNSPWSLANEGYKYRLSFNVQDVVLLDNTEVWEVEDTEVASDDDIAV